MLESPRFLPKESLPHLLLGWAVRGPLRPACPGSRAVLWTRQMASSTASPAGAAAPSCHRRVHTPWSGKKASCQTLHFPKLQREGCLAPHLSGVAGSVCPTHAFKWMPGRSDLKSACAAVKHNCPGPPPHPVLGMLSLMLWFGPVTALFSQDEITLQHSTVPAVFPESPDLHSAHFYKIRKLW